MVFQPEPLVSSIEELVLGMANIEVHKESTILKARWMLFDRILECNSHQAPLTDSRARDAMSNEEELI